MGETATVDPTSSSFSEADYKAKMLEAYEKQQRENAEILRKRKEREAQGLHQLLKFHLFLKDQEELQQQLLQKRKRRKDGGNVDLNRCIFNSYLYFYIKKKNKEKNIV